VDLRDGPVKTDRPFVRIPDVRRSAFLLPALLISCHGLRSPETSQDRLLATIPPGVEVRVPVVFSADGRVAAYVADTADGARVVKGDWKSRRLDAI